MSNPGSSGPGHFMSAGLGDGDSTAFYDLIAVHTGLKPEFALLVSAELLRSAIDWKRPVVDSEQIHVCDWPMRDSGARPLL